MNDIAIIQTARDYFLRDSRLKLAILFGSFATKKNSLQSDLDVAVAYGHQLSIDEKVTIAQNLSIAINREVDLIDLFDANGVLLQQILNNRVTLVNRDSELYGKLISKRVTEEADFMPLYDAMLKARRERFIHGKGFLVI